MIHDLDKLYHRDTYEDHGPVLWHRLDKWNQVCEAPFVATSLDDLEDNEPWEGYYTHWSRLPPFENTIVVVSKGLHDFDVVCDHKSRNKKCFTLSDFE